MDFPFQQELFGNKIRRTFSPEVDSSELKWHQDLKDRRVKILQNGGWSYQPENELPTKLSDGQELWIPKFAWHRVLKGNEPLLIEIEEFD